MNIIGSSRSAKLGRGRISPGESQSKQQKPSCSFYEELPNFELSLDDFEEYALKRLKVLRKIEELKVRNVTGESYRIQLSKTIKENIDDATVDLASHFILRAAYCRTEDLRRWFLTHEGYLFKYRVEALPESSLKAVLKQVDLQKVPNSEKDRLRDSLMSIPGVTPTDFASQPYYAIPFQQALDLVSSRSCFVRKGLAYVPLPKVVSILAAKFRTSLSRSLALASAAFQTVEEEARIAPLLKTMNSQITSNKGLASEQLAGQTQVNAQTIDGLSANMPLCMSQLHVGLKRDHKLKHWGRLQYGLFLKGAGMSMEESLLFFQSIFSKIMTTEQFQKNYSYNIRHMYGKEGKRASYTPYNCKKIIFGQAPQAGDHHGCPYKHYDANHLRSLLGKLQIGSSSDRAEILRLSESQNYQLACLKHFEVTHPGAIGKDDVNMENVGNHPNSWFHASVSYHGGNEKGLRPVTPETVDETE